MKRSIYILVMMALCSVTHAQNIIVNPDGTHSVVINHGNNTGIIVNPDGTHTTVHQHNENTTVLVTPDGKHSLLQKHGKTNIIVKPDGTHMIATNQLADSTTKDTLIIYNADSTYFRQVIYHKPNRTTD